MPCKALKWRLVITQFSIQERKCGHSDMLLITERGTSRHLKRSGLYYGILGIVLWWLSVCLFISYFILKVIFYIQELTFYVSGFFVFTFFLQCNKTHILKLTWMSEIFCVPLTPQLTSVLNEWQELQWTQQPSVLSLYVFSLFQCRCAYTVEKDTSILDPLLNL